MTDSLTHPTRRRIVLCRGCNTDGIVDKFYKKLLPIVEEINGDTHPPRIKLEFSSCLDMCETGPNIVVYPDNIPLNYVDDAKLDEMIETYLKPLSS